MIDALRKKFPKIKGPHAQDICYATENRQTGGERCGRTMQICCWWWVRRTVPTPTGWWKLPEPGHAVVPDRELPSDIKPEWLVGREDRGADRRRFGAGILVEQVVDVP